MFDSSPVWAKFHPKVPHQKTPSDDKKVVILNQNKAVEATVSVSEPH